MGISVSIESITFSDGTAVALAPDSVVVMLGPNNTGKTTTLNELILLLRGGSGGVIVKGATVSKSGTPEEAIEWLDQSVAYIKGEKSYDVAQYAWLEQTCIASHARDAWKGTQLGSLTEIFCASLSVEQRLGVVKPVDAIDLLSEAPKHPFHVLFHDDRLEQVVSNQFRLAFGTDVILNRGSGGKIQMHFGQRPSMMAGEDRVSRAYLQRLQSLPLLHRQGHGIRSFAGCVLHIVTSPSFIQFIDEPEAFLHPPQARLLGQLLVSGRRGGRQIIMATHSGDLLRGVLDRAPSSLQVVRLSREGNQTKAFSLDRHSIERLWSDPILRFSNVLDGLFHDTVIVTEADSDCRFYAAILDTVVESNGWTRPDAMFSASGGKQRIPVIVSSLRTLGVNTFVIADFDVLRDKKDVRGILESLGADWVQFETDWNIVFKALEQKAPALSLAQVKESVFEILNSQAGSRLTSESEERIKSAMKANSPWQAAKMAGTQAMPSGDPSAAIKRLFASMRSKGLFVVPCGEIERFAPTVPGHGPRWVSDALQRNIASDHEFESARNFIRDILFPGMIKSVAVPPTVSSTVPTPAGSEGSIEVHGSPSATANRTGILARLMGGRQENS